jgi:hypothetical protein
VSAPGHIRVTVLDQFDGCRDVMIAPMTCAVDGREHAVADTAIETAGGRGTYRALCGREVMPGSLATPPGRPCPACLRRLAAQLKAQPAKPGLPRPEPRWRAAIRRVFGRSPAPSGPRPT